MGASPFSPPTPEGRGVGVERKVAPLNLSKNIGLGAGGWGGLVVNVVTRSGARAAPGRCNPLQPARAGALGAGTSGPGMAR